MIYKDLLQHFIETEQLEKQKEQFNSKGFIDFRSNTDGIREVHFYKSLENNIEQMLNMTNLPLIIKNFSKFYCKVVIKLQDFDIFTLEEPQYVDEMLAEQPKRFIDKRRPQVILGERVSNSYELGEF